MTRCLPRPRRPAASGQTRRSAPAPQTRRFGADTQVCPGPADLPLRGRHAGLPLRWMRYLFKDHKRAALIRSRSLTGKAAGLYPASAGSARDPSSNLGGSNEIMAGVAQTAERLAVNQIVAGSSPATRPDLLGSGAIGGAAVLEIAGCRFDPYLPNQFLRL